MSDVDPEVWRTHTPAVLAALLRRSGDFGACEDAVQEALLAAAVQWPRDGMPQDPRGWLIRVASRRLIDAERAEAARTRREDADAALEPAHARVAPAAEASALAAGSGQDETLRMLLLCAHPALPPPAQVALALRAVAGLTTAQIAAGFLVPESTMAQRISRAKARLREAGGRFPGPTEAELPERLAAVRRALYLAFTEGHTASAGPGLWDRDLTREAIRLTERLHRATPGDPETAGLLALMLLAEARAPARMTAAGDLVPLSEQDRRRWRRADIERGVALVTAALPHGPTGPFQLQAAIAAVHAEAPSWEATDWLQIAILYRMLLRAAPSPAAEIGLAVAIGMAHGPDAGQIAIAPLLERPEVVRGHRVHAAYGHLLELAGRRGEARAVFELAARLTASIPEQRYLARKAGAAAGAVARPPDAGT